MSEEELALVETLGGCAAEYARLWREETKQQRLPTDIEEFVAHVHDCQARVMWLAARRAHPERLR